MKGFYARGFRPSRTAGQFTAQIGEKPREVQIGGMHCRDKVERAAKAWTFHTTLLKTRQVKAKDLADNLTVLATQKNLLADRYSLGRRNQFSIIMTTAKPLGGTLHCRM